MNGFGNGKILKGGQHDHSQGQCDGSHRSDTSWDHILPRRRQIQNGTTEESKAKQGQNSQEYPSNNTRFSGTNVSKSEFMKKLTISKTNTYRMN
jgi:hypothetical protein